MFYFITFPKKEPYENTKVSFVCFYWYRALHADAFQPHGGGVKERVSKNDAFFPNDAVLENVSSIIPALGCCSAFWGSTLKNSNIYIQNIHSQMEPINSVQTPHTTTILFTILDRLWSYNPSRTFSPHPIYILIYVQYLVQISSLSLLCTYASVWTEVHSLVLF